MLAQLSQWILIAALGQAPAEAALLKAAPADVDVAVRIPGVEATRDDLLAMLRAMNRDWANMATVTNNPNLKPPADLPADPAFLGASLTPHAPEGYEFHLVIPTSVGTVIAKGLVPIFQGLAQ